MVTRRLTHKTYLFQESDLSEEELDLMLEIMDPSELDNLLEGRWSLDEFNAVWAARRREHASASMAVPSTPCANPLPPPPTGVPVTPIVGQATAEVVSQPCATVSSGSATRVVQPPADSPRESQPLPEPAEGVNEVEINSALNPSNDYSLQYVFVLG